mmetsp:Transcript_30236/g.76640  ORF Transcript_30236/g.76640 Transcript_30236/m.76640 type:complete len:246 (-) Transcript_30236:449-1186(-)
MRRTGTQRIFTMDSDAIITANISELAASDAPAMARADIWLVYAPPRTAMPFVFITLAALEDVTAFWTRMLQPDVWLPKHVGGTKPNDMIAMGHYVHTNVGPPYPCWGLSGAQPKLRCGDGNGSYTTLDYGIPDILHAIRRVGLTANFRTETLGLGAGGRVPLDAGIVDGNYRDDALQMFAMVNQQKQIRFVNGSAQLLLRSGKWVPTWGYVMEDKAERCAGIHVRRISSRASCRCENWCCRRCQP